MYKKILFLFEIGYILIDLNQIFLMKPSEFKIFISVESCDEKTTENYQNCYVGEKRILNFQRYRSYILIAKIEFSRLYLLYFPRNEPSNSVTAGLGRFIILNDLSSHKMVINIYIIFLQFFPKSQSCMNLVEAAHI